MKTYKLEDGKILVESTVVPEKIETKKYNYKSLLARKSVLENALSEVNAIISEAEKLGAAQSE